MDTIDILKGVTMVLDVLTNEDILLDGYGDIFFLNYLFHI